MIEFTDVGSAHEHWLTLTNTLSGLFCASLNFIDSSKSISPEGVLEPESRVPASEQQKLHLVHGSLPREVVCTENLTPFLKLLPCQGKAGVSSVLDGHKLFDASWQSMSVVVQRTCATAAKCMYNLEQSIDMVLDLERSKRPRGEPAQGV